MRVSTTIAIGFVVCVLGAASLTALPVLDATSGLDNETIEELRASVNETPKNVYVVKAVVYEIGILTEVDENDTSFESQERVDLTFYDAHTNQSHIDLGNIPLPIQTNISGQVLTGIAPVNLGAFGSASELLQTLPFTGTIVNITHSDTAFYQLSRSNASESERPHVLNSEELAGLPQVTNLFPAKRGQAALTQQNLVIPPPSDKSRSKSLESKEDD